MSLDQKEELVSFLTSHPEMVKNKFSAKVTFAGVQKLWETLTNAVNAQPGAKKDKEGWQKTWADLRRQTRKRAADIIKDIRKTGGGESSVPPLSDIENRVIALVGETSATGDVTTAELGFDESITDQQPHDIQEDVLYELKRNNAKMEEYKERKITFMELMSRVEKRKLDLEEAKLRLEEKKISTGGEES